MFGSPLLITTVDSIVVLLYGAWKYKAYATSSFDQLQPVFLSTITVNPQAKIKWSKSTIA
jgi:hypothetical protein